MVLFRLLVMNKGVRPKSVVALKIQTGNYSNWKDVDKLELLKDTTLGKNVETQIDKEEILDRSWFKCE